MTSLFTPTIDHGRQSAVPFLTFDRWQINDFSVYSYNTVDHGRQSAVPLLTSDRWQINDSSVFSYNTVDNGRQSAVPLLTSDRWQINDSSVYSYNTVDNGRQSAVPLLTSDSWQMNDSSVFLAHGEQIDITLLTSCSWQTKWLPPLFLVMAVLFPNSRLLAGRQIVYFPVLTPRSWQWLFASSFLTATDRMLGGFATHWADIQRRVPHWHGS